MAVKAYSRLCIMFHSLAVRLRPTSGAGCHGMFTITFVGRQWLHLSSSSCRWDQVRCQNLGIVKLPSLNSNHWFRISLDEATFSEGLILSLRPTNQKTHFGCVHGTGGEQWLEFERVPKHLIKSQLTWPPIFMATFTQNYPKVDGMGIWKNELVSM